MTTAAQKPKLILATGKNAMNMTMLARLFEKLMGRKPTQEELDDARVKYGDRIKG